MSTVVEASPIEKASREPLPKGDSCLLVLFGASGDLARRKLIPSLFNLACAGCMNPQFEVLGLGRTPKKSEEFRRTMHDAASQASDTRDFSEDAWKKFEGRLHYLTGDFNQSEFWTKLSDHIQAMQKAGSSGNHLFYLSTPASEAKPIIEGLASVGLNHSSSGWSRIIVEKPFGHDLKSAQELNEVVGKAFEEKDVYRIDHFLGKETVQNIMVFRFGNSMFEPIWNRNYIDHVEIVAAEKLGVEGRGKFYEETGALRDMVANHMLQLLALTAMEPPIAFDPDSPRDQKVQLLRSIRPMSKKQVAQRTGRGQYGPGKIDGKDVPGYRQEPDVAPDSLTPTYAAVEFFVDNWRWAGVPFYVRTGKCLSQHLTEIRVCLKRTPQALFAGAPESHIGPNVISMRIQPDEGISISFGAKRPGNQMKMVGVQARFSYKAMFGSDVPVAYETLLLDAMRGDPTLFTRRDEVEAEWRIITPILEAWEQLPAPKFPNYAAGSEGPREAGGWTKTADRQA